MIHTKHTKINKYILSCLYAFFTEHCAIQMVQASLMQFGFKTRKPQDRSLKNNKVKLDANCWYILDTVPEEVLPVFNDLWNLHPEELGEIVINGNPVTTPRYFQSFGRNYTFSGKVHEHLPVPGLLTDLLSWVKETYSCDFNQILVNWYADGSHYIGPHSDNISNLVDGSPIVSISLGGTRKFHIRAKDKKDSSGIVKKDITLVHGTVLVMGGDMQEHYTHAVPKTKKIVKPRINIMFREMKPDKNNKRKNSFEISNNEPGERILSQRKIEI